MLYVKLKRGSLNPFSMKIVRYLNTTKEEVESKKFNIWIGCSLGNLYFNEQNIKEYILWALQYTKDKVLVVIPDRIHAINLEVLDGYSRERSHKVALRKGDEKVQIVENIIKTLPEKDKQRIVVARLSDVEKSKYHDYRIKELFEEFNKKGDFYKTIISIVNENSKVKTKKLTQEQLEKLSEYVLSEIPIFLNGAKYGGKPEDGGKTYSLNIYPGLGSVDYLLNDLQKSTLFPELSKRLKITDEIAILEAYVD